MTLIETYKELINELNLHYDDRESRSITLLLLEALGLNNLSISLQPSFQLTSEHLSFLNDKMEELKKGVPVQYVLGKTEFYGLTFFVNKHVLIPRPETEELVDLILKRNNKSRAVILDVGTGSGCIAIALAKHIQGSSVFAVDISVEALTTARKNALQNEAEIEFIIDDILNPSYNWGKRYFDIIVSNPPYVLEEDKTEMKPNVLNYEPSGALFADISDPILFYRRIFDFAGRYLKTGGFIYLEINENLGKEIGGLAKVNGFIDVEVLRDINGRERFVTGEKD